MEKHDKLFKALLNYFLADFIEVFFPTLFERLDFSELEFLDKELLEALDKEEYSKEADLLASVKLKGQNTTELLAIHIEHQSSNQVNFEERMYDYSCRLWLKLKRKIWPIAVFSCENQVNIANSYSYGITTFGEQIFRFDLLDLRKLEYRKFSKITNSILPVLRMKMKKEDFTNLELKIKIFQEIFEIENDKERFWRLSSFVNSYLPLTQNEEQVFRQELKIKEPQKMLDLLDLMKEEATEKGLQKGLRKGIQKGFTKGKLDGVKTNLIRLIKKKFNFLPKPFQQKINQTENLETLEQWLDNLIFAQKIEDVFN